MQIKVKKLQVLLRELLKYTHKIIEYYSIFLVFLDIEKNDF